MLDQEVNLPLNFSGELNGFYITKKDSKTQLVKELKYMERTGDWSRYNPKKLSMILPIYLSEVGWRSYLESLDVKKEVD